MDDVRSWRMHHYNFHISGPGLFQCNGLTHEGDDFTISGKFWQEGGLVNVTFDKTYIEDGSEITWRYSGAIDQQSETLSGTLTGVPNVSDNFRVDENHSAVILPPDVHKYKFSFQHRVTPYDLRKRGPPVYLVDLTLTRKWCMEFFFKRGRFCEDTTAGEELFALLSPEEYLKHWNAYGLQIEEVWGRAVNHQ